MERLISVDEVAEMLNFAPATIRQKVWRRELPYVKLGKSIRFKEEEILQIIEDSRVPVKTDHPRSVCEVLGVSKAELRKALRKEKQKLDSRNKVEQIANQRPVFASRTTEELDELDAALAAQGLHPVYRPPVQ